MPEKFYDNFFEKGNFSQTFHSTLLNLYSSVRKQHLARFPSGLFFVRHKTFFKNAVQPSPIAKLDRRAGLYPRKSIQSRPLFVYPYFLRFLSCV
ncbi:hypothetical protein D3C87_1093300 [compost metagenome]